VEVRIGIKHSPRELTFEMSSDPEDVRKQIEQAVAADHEMLSLTDTRGRQFLIDTDSISYVEIGAEAGRKVGFVS
jgi:hypothetical protein